MLSHLEARLQTLIEGGVAHFFPDRVTPHELALRLEEAMRSGVYTTADGVSFAPNLFVLHMHPEHFQVLQADTVLLDNLAQALRDSSQEAGFCFASPVVVRLQTDPDLMYGEILAVAQNSQEDLPSTTLVDVARSTHTAAIPKNAFLVVDGVQVFALVRATINIGRRPGNQLVINDRRVSRQHAQLRAIRGHYVIFDLASAGGTWVNGERIQQHILQPGDVISLAGVPLVFGQEDADSTQDLSFDPDYRNTK